MAGLGRKQNGCFEVQWAGNQTSSPRPKAFTQTRKAFLRPVKLPSPGADFVWLGAAVLGLALLLPLDTSKALDPLGVAFACGAAACWALYVVSARKVSGPLGSRAVAWGMLVAALIAFPFGMARAGTALFDPGIVATGLLVAVLSSVMPYLIEIVAMNHLTASVVGLSLGAAPAAGALVGLLVLRERLLPIQGVAILCIIGASVGCALASSRSRPTDVDAR